MGTFLSDLLANGIRVLRNGWRLWGRRAPDYVLIEIKGSLSERRPPRRPLIQRLLPFGEEPLSIEELNERLDVIAATPRVRGVVLRIGNISAGLARVQNVRAAIQRFRARGKRAVAHLNELTLGSYLIASSADEVLVPESADFNVVGIAGDFYYLAEALAAVGLEVEAQAAGEYKSAPETFTRSSMSDAAREMMEAELDSVFSDVISAVATDRGLSAERVRRLIDEAPFPPVKAVAEGLVDGVRYEDELAGHLGDGNRQARIETWGAARRRLRLPLRWRYAGAIAVVSLRGAIYTGESQQYPVPIPFLSTIAGSETLTRALRRAERDPRVAAVVFYVDSPGGTEIASDLIWREVDRVRRRKPLVAYMGGLAASGGYYVSAPASCIVAQSASLTGSIGVFELKPTVTGLLGRAHVHVELLARGRHALDSSPARAWDDPTRQHRQARVEDHYALFKRRVAEGRRMSEEEVERVARGRVWTGSQALERGLVDELGDFEVAVRRAKELAGLPLDRYVPVVPIVAPRRFALPQVFPEDTGFGAWLPPGLRDLLHGGVWAIMPWHLRLRM